MPAVSQKQRAYLYATKGAAWVNEHHFNNKGKLPMTATKQKSKKPAVKAAVLAAVKKMGSLELYKKAG